MVPRGPAASPGNTSGALAPFRGAIRVKPGSKVAGVGGSHPGFRPGDDASLIVAVTARAVDGAATSAAEKALAAALGLRANRVSVVRGATSRDKLVEISDPDPDLPARWAQLRDR